MITDPAVGELPPRAADRVAALLRDPQEPAKLLVTGGIGSGKSAVLAAVRDGLRAAGVPVVTQVRPEVPGSEPCRSALVIDDADRLDDGALAALVTVAADPCRTVVVATQPLGQRPELRRLTDVLEHEQTALVLPTRGAPDPDRLRRLDEPLLDALALPSHTTPRWKEQFGRVLTEAMSCGLPVIGSSSGEIPNVVGDAGLIFREGDVPALAAAIARLADSPALCADLGRRGRARVLAHYTQAALARSYYQVYRSMLG